MGVSFFAWKFANVTHVGHATAMWPMSFQRRLVAVAWTAFTGFTFAAWREGAKFFTQKKSTCKAYNDSQFNSIWSTRSVPAVLFDYLFFSLTRHFQDSIFQNIYCNASQTNTSEREDQKCQRVREQDFTKLTAAAVASWRACFFFMNLPID